MSPAKSVCSCFGLLLAAPLLGCSDDTSSQSGSADSGSTSTSTSPTSSTASTSGTPTGATDTESGSTTTTGDTGTTADTDPDTTSTGSESTGGSTGAQLETGDVVWERNIDVENMDEAIDVAWAPTGDVYVTGESNAGGTQTESNLVIWSLDADDGTDQWSDVHESVDAASGRSVDVTTGGVVVGGYTSAGSNLTREHVRVYTHDGTESWTYTGTSDFVSGRGVAFHPGGDVLFVSHAGSGLSFTRRIASPGSVAWTDTRSMQTLTDVAVDGDGTVYVVGGGGGGAWIASLSPDGGTENWSEIWVASDTTFVNAVEVGPTGDVFTVGPVIHPDYDWDVAVQRWSAADGSLVWAIEHDLTGNSFEEAFAITVGSTGRTLVCGFHDAGNDVGAARTWVGELNDSGDLVWDRSYDTRLCNGIAIDDEDYAYLAGISGPNTDYDAWVAKIAP